MLKSNNQKAIQSQRWIIQALLNLMKVMNYNEITVSEICRKAELDRRTFYRNFHSKDDVLEQYISILGDEYISTYRGNENLDCFIAIKIFFEFWKSHLDFIKNIQNCGLSNFVFKRFEDFTKNQNLLLSCDNTPKMQSEYVLAYRIGGFWNVMLAWVADNAQLSPSEMASIISEI